MAANDCVSATVADISDLDEEGNCSQFWKSEDRNRLSAFSSNGRYWIDYVLFFYNKGIHNKFSSSTLVLKIKLIGRIFYLAGSFGVITKTVEEIPLVFPLFQKGDSYARKLSFLL